MIDEVVATLKARQRARGDQAQVLRAEEANARMSRVEAKMDAIIKHMGIHVPPQPQVMVSH